MQPHRQTRQTIVRLLSSMASQKEISQYLKRFSQVDAKRFAVVKVGGAVLRDDLDALTSSLAFLQEVGLTPIVLHGAGPQLDAELAAAGEQDEGGAKTLHVLLHFSHCCGAAAALLPVLKPLPVMPLSGRLAIAKTPIPLQARLTSPFKPPIFV